MQKVILRLLAAYFIVSGIIQFVYFLQRLWFSAPGSFDIGKFVYAGLLFYGGTELWGFKEIGRKIILLLEYLQIAWTLVLGIFAIVTNQHSFTYTILSYHNDFDNPVIFFLMAAVLALLSGAVVLFLSRRGTRMLFEKVN